MKISVVIVAFNELRDLEATIALVYASDPKPHEILVVDDCSTTPVAPRLKSFPNVRVIRNNTQLGAGPSKTRGFNETSGDVVVLLDAHMRMPMDWLLKVKQAVEQFPRSIFCTTCVGFEIGGSFVASGTSFGRKGYNFINPSWLPRGVGIDTCPMIHGACYIIPRHIWKAVGGMNPAFHGWGGEELDLSLRCHLLGYGVRRMNDLVVAHHFKQPVEKGHRMGSWESHYNWLVIGYTFFPIEVFEKLMAPHVQDVAAWQKFNEMFEVIKQAREFVQSRRVIDDEELQRKAGFFIPTPDEQKLFASDPKSTTMFGIGRDHRQTILKSVFRHNPHGRMLEWGSGFSTLWFRQELKADSSQFVSIEHDRKWAKITQARHIHAKPDSPPVGVFAEECHKGVILTNQKHQYVNPKGLGLFDTVLVDGVFRNACLMKAPDMLRKGGRLFLHDAQRDWYELGRHTAEQKGIRWLTEHKACPDCPGPTLLEGVLE